MSLIEKQYYKVQPNAIYIKTISLHLVSVGGGGGGGVGKKPMNCILRQER